MDSDSVITLEGSTITGNDSYVGGGVALRDGSHMTFNETLLSYNSATYGGGAQLYLATLVLNGSSEVSQNTGDIFGGGLYLYGSELSGGAVRNNDAGQGGGALVA